LPVVRVPRRTVPPASRAHEVDAHPSVGGFHVVRARLRRAGAREGPGDTARRRDGATRRDPQPRLAAQRGGGRHALRVRARRRGEPARRAARLAPPRRPARLRDLGLSMEEALTDRRRPVLLVRRRVLFTALFLATVGGMSLLFVDMLQRTGMTGAEYAILVLSILLLLPVVFSFWIAFFGFLVEWRGR